MKHWQRFQSWVLEALLADAEEALTLGYDLMSVGKAYLVEPNWLEKY